MLHTETTCVEAVKQAEAPFTLSVLSYRTVQSIPITAYSHLGFSLQNTEGAEVIEYFMPVKIGRIHT
jgi:hypothetical protein